MRIVCFDLDDTLCKEIDYLKSAFNEIAEYAAIHCEGCSDSVKILAIKAYNRILGAYRDGYNAFDELNGFLGIELPLSDYLCIYRNHKPKITLSKDVANTLDALKRDNVRLGLITDGRSMQQRNKIEALGLDRWIGNEDIVISEEFGSEKPSLTNYEYFMNRYPECVDFSYVGDNPQKDFIAPNALGWMTICLQDNGQNVHKQDSEHPLMDARPKRIINRLAELL